MLTPRSHRTPLWLQPFARAPEPLRRRVLESLLNRGLTYTRLSGALDALHGKVISLALTDLGLVWSGVVCGQGWQRQRVILLEPQRAETHLETLSTVWLSLLQDSRPHSDERAQWLARIHFYGHPDTIAALQAFLAGLDARHQPPLWTAALQTLQHRLAQPIGLQWLSRGVERVVNQLYAQHPNARQRLQPIYAKRFVIRIQESPWDLTFSLHRNGVQLRGLPRRHWAAGDYDVLVTGPWRTLVDILEGNQDGDAQFFSRTLKVQGDMDILVMLRNVLDNEEISLRGELLALLGSAGRPVHWLTERLRAALGVAYVAH